MSALGEAARIFVTVGLNAGAASAGLRQLGSDVDHFGTKMSTWSKTVSASFAGPMQAFGNIGDAADGVKSVAGAVSAFTQTLLGGAARNEQYATSFEVLLGSADKAQAKLKELRQFANTTPFTLPGVVEAAKMLEIMGGAALDTDANLRMVGDAASFAGQDIKDVAVYFGRLYDGMKNGTPLGEVNMRLQEMGLMSGQTRKKVTELAEGVANGSMTMEDAWKSLGGEFKRFSGQTAKQAETLNGLWSTFTDAIDDGIATIGTRFLPTIKPALKGAIELFGHLGEAGLWAIDNFQMFAPVVFAVLIPAVTALTVAVYHLAAGVVLATWPFVAIGAAVAATLAIIQQLFPNMDVLDTLFKGIGVVVQFVADVFGVLDSAMRVVGDTVEMILSPLARLNDALFGVPQPAKDAANSIYLLGQTMDYLPGKLNDTAVDIAKAAKQNFEPIETEASKAARKAVFSVTTMNADILASFKATRDEVNGAASALSSAITRPFEIAAEVVKTKNDIIEAGQDAHNKKLTADERAQAVLTLRQRQADLFNLLNEETTYGTTQERIARINALLTSNAYAETLKNGTPEQKAAYALWVTTMQTQLAALEGVARTEAGDAGKAVGPGFKNNLPKDTTFYTWGYNGMDSYSDGFAAALDELKNRLRKQMGVIKGMLESSSPPGPASPLHKIDVWGYSTGEAWAEGLGAAIKAARGTVSGALTTVGSGLTPATMGGGGGGVTVNVGSFYGTEDNIRELSRELGEVVRYSTLRRTS